MGDNVRYERRYGGGDTNRRLMELGGTGKQVQPQDRGKNARQADGAHCHKEAAEMGNWDKRRFCGWEAYTVYGNACGEVNNWDPVDGSKILQVLQKG